MADVSPVELLNAHADALWGRGEWPAPPSDEAELAALTALAARVQAALIPARPWPAFVEALEHELTRPAAPAVEILPSRRPPWIIGAAAVGSAISLLGLYHVLRRSRSLLKRAS